MLAPLRDVVASLESGARPKGGVTSSAGEIPSLGGEHVASDGSLILSNVKRIPKSFYDNLRSGQIQPRDILVVKDGATTGKTGIVPDDFPFRDAAVNEHVFIVRVNRKKAEPSYVYHHLRSPLGQSGILSDFRGATVGGISRGFLDRVLLPLPPLPEQRRIAAILDQADALRVKRRAAIAELETLKQSVFIEMFGDPRNNLNKWPTLPFVEVCPTHLGKMLDAKQQTGKYLRPYVRNVNVQWLSLDLSDVAEMDFPPDVRNKYRLVDGDLLICEGGEPGRAAIWHGEIDECYFQKAVHRGRPIRNIATPEYLVMLLWFLSKRGLLAYHITSATIAHLTGEKLRKMLIPVPPIAIQEYFSQLLVAIQEKAALQETSSSELDDLFSSLQHRAFQGEL